jgi:hypothetical protein
MTVLRNTSLTRLLAAFSLTLLAGCAQVPALDDGAYKASQMLEQGDHDGVIALLQPMADRDPNLSTTSLDLLGMAYFNNRQYPKAAAILERATAPGMFSGMPFGGRRINMRNHGVLGWCYFHMKDLDRATAAFDKALAKSDFRREPAWDESALRGRAWTRYFRGDFQGCRIRHERSPTPCQDQSPNINTPTMITTGTWPWPTSAWACSGTRTRIPWPMPPWLRPKKPGFHPRSSAGTWRPSTWCWGSGTRPMRSLAARARWASRCRTTPMAEGGGYGWKQRYLTVPPGRPG